MSSRPASLFLPLALSLACMAAPSWSQVHEARAGDYALRSSTVSSTMISADVASKHGIVPSPTRGILNVTVTRAQQTVPARVEVVARNLTGHATEVGMAQTTANGYVSYTGAYDFVHGEVLDFTVRAKPQGSEEVLTLTFRDRMWGRGDLPETPARR